MRRNLLAASIISLSLCGLAVAEPQTVSFYLGGCNASGACQVAASLPPQGFVLTDIIYGTASVATLDLSIQEGSTTKVRFVMGDLGGGNTVRVQSYHLASGVPFVGSSTLTTVGALSGDQRVVTLVGYIPGTQAQSVPAMGNIALSIMTLLILGAGGYILRKRSPIRWNATT